MDKKPPVHFQYAAFSGKDNGLSDEVHLYVGRGCTVAIILNSKQTGVCSFTLTSIHHLIKVVPKLVKLFFSLATPVKKKL